MAKAAAIKEFVASGGLRKDAIREFRVSSETVIFAVGCRARLPPPRPDGPVVWTPALVRALIEGWYEGLSMTEIARKIGVGKGHVAGKKHRLKLPNRGSPIPAVEQRA